MKEIKVIVTLRECDILRKWHKGVAFVKFKKYCDET